MAVIYKSEQIEVEYDKGYHDFYVTIYDEDGLESEYVNFSREEMSRLVKIIKEKLDEV